LLRFDGVTERRADGGTAIGVLGGDIPVGSRPRAIGLPVGPSGGDADTWFRMIRPAMPPKPVRGPDNAGDLRLVSRMSDRNVSCRVLSLTPFQCNDMKQPLGQAVTSGWVPLTARGSTTLDQI
jgi:hypothetical protein